MNRPRIPRTTYRVQISDRFTLFEAAALVGYLELLGVDAIYVSPLLQAVEGSSHGYDVVDHARVDEHRGGAAGFAALVGACSAAGLGLVVDIVPNHMGVGAPAENERWWALLRDGPDSEAARWFDVDWAANEAVRLPILASGTDLATEVALVGERLVLQGLELPIAPGSSRPGLTALEVLAGQHYEPIPTERANADLNYRRFFAVSSLAAIRVEDQEVFEASHAKVLSWVEDGLVTGVRVDHPDGLADPGQYLERLAGRMAGRWLVVEKILEPGETLPEEWPVDGTTGYDALSEVLQLLLDPDAERAVEETYRSLTKDDRDWAEHVFDAKFHVATSLLAAEVHRIARLLPEVEDAAEAIAALAAALPVYRTYLPVGRERLREAVEVLATRRPDLRASVEALLGSLEDPRSEACTRFQQLTGAVMAKGLEDTALYRYTRLLALNEVGSSPGSFGGGLSGFHAAMRRRVEQAPASMTTLSTHDTKRGEDARARLAVLAELPGEWGRTAAWLLEHEPVPNLAFGYLLWQSVVGVGLVERERLHDFAEKAMREADDGTSWTHPDVAFERAVHAALDGAYDHPATRARLESFIARIEPFGWSNSLLAKLVQLTMPGVPDVYQGSERYEGSLVDPDNRRPVDFAALADSLARLTEPPDASDPRGRKQFLTQAALRARRDRPELFSRYQALPVEGRHADHLVAFDRGGALTLGIRLPAGLAAAGGFDEERVVLPPGVYRNVLENTSWSAEVTVAEVLGSWPVALLLEETV